MKYKIKKDDEVVVIAGKGRKTNQRGKVLKVDPVKQRVLVEGVNMVKRHTKKTQDDQQGGIIELEAPLHISNIMKADRFDAKRSKKKS